MADRPTFERSNHYIQDLIPCHGIMGVFWVIDETQGGMTPGHWQQPVRFYAICKSRTWEERRGSLNTEPPPGTPLERCSPHAMFIGMYDLERDDELAQFVGCYDVDATDAELALRGLVLEAHDAAEREIERRRKAIATED